MFGINLNQNQQPANSTPINLPSSMPINPNKIKQMGGTVTMNKPPVNNLNSGQVKAAVNLPPVTQAPKPMNFTPQQTLGLQAAWDRGETGATNANIKYAMERGWKPQAKTSSVTSNPTGSTPAASLNQNLTQPSNIGGSTPVQNPAQINPVQSANDKLSALYDKLNASMLPSDQEKSVQNQITTLNDAARQGIQNVQDQTIPMQFITGQQQSIENRATNQRQTLTEQLAALQNQRLANINASNAAAGVAGTQLTNAQNAANFGNSLQQNGYTPFNGIQSNQINFKQGINPTQQAGILSLANKVAGGYTMNAKDQANWNYATGNQDINALLPNNLQTYTNPYTGQKQQFSAPITQGAVTLNAGQQLVSPKTGQVVSGNADDYKMDANSIKLLAQQYIASGGQQQPSFGNGAIGLANKKAFYDEVTAQAGSQGLNGSDITGQAYNQYANRQALAQVNERLNIASASENKVNSQLDMLTRMAPQVPRSNSPLWNGIIQNINNGIWTSDPKLSAFQNTVVETLVEYAKVMTGATGGSGVTDAANAQAQSLLNSAQSPAAFSANIAAMKQGMKNAINGWKTQKDSILKSISQPVGSNGSGSSGSSNNSTLDGIWG